MAAAASAAVGSVGVVTILPKTPLPILVIGSGLGGLTLAHALRAHSIPYRLFERDAATDDRAQGYRISVDDGGASALKSALGLEGDGPALFGEFEQSCGERHGIGGRIDAVSGKVLQRGVLGLLGAGGWGMLGELAGRWAGKKWSEGTWSDWAKWAGSFVYNPNPSKTLSVPQTVNKHYQVDRRVLRNLLLRSQADHITHSAVFTSYTLPSGADSASSPSSPSASLPRSDGSDGAEGVIAHFADGTSVRGSLLVGADGVRSCVAAQLLGHSAIPRDLGTRIIYGKTPLSPSVEEGLHLTLSKGCSFVVDPTAAATAESAPGDEPGLLLVHECMRFHHPSAPADYSFWALAGRKEIFERSETELRSSLPASTSASASDPSPADIALHLTKHWHPSIRLLFTQQDPNQTASLRMTSSSTSGTATWPTDPRVTVLGDAIHCMPPTGGQGANTALHDAALLGLVLGKAKEEGEGVEGKGWSKETVELYEDGMRRNIGDVVGMAVIGAKRIIGADMPEL